MPLSSMLWRLCYAAYLLLCYAAYLLLCYAAYRDLLICVALRKEGSWRKAAVLGFLVKMELYEGSYFASS